MICRYCGKEIPDDVAFCTECGHIIDRPNKGRGTGNKGVGAFLHNAFLKQNGPERKYSGWVKKLLTLEVIAVILGFLLIVGLLEGSGSYNRKLFPDQSRIGFEQQFHWSVQGLSFEEKIVPIVRPRVKYLEEISSIWFDEYELVMDLPAGPCTGKYIIVHNENDITVDAKAGFSFYDTPGRLTDKSSFDEYGIAAHGTGIVFGQTDEQEISHIERKISVFPSDFIPVSDCVSYTVIDHGEKGIRVTVKNHSDINVEDFRIRVLWFQDSQLETVAYRWLELEDHTFYAGQKKTLDFNRKWGEEKYLIFLQGKARRQD